MKPSIKHIIAATDLSGASLNAVDRGLALAAATGARCTLLHALGLDAASPLRRLLGEQEAGAVAQRALAHQRAVLEDIAHDRAQRHGARPEVLVEPGLPNQTVPAQAAAAGADLVVVGARGDGHLRRLVLGSTASHLLRKSPCPVLVAKNPCQGPYRRVLVPVDFSPGAAQAIELAHALAPQADLVLLHVFDVPFEGVLQYGGVSPAVVEQYRGEARERAQQQLRALADGLGLAPGHCTCLVEPGDTVAQITRAQERLGCELIAMGKHGTHVTEELLLGSVTRRVLAEGDADVLVVVDRRLSTPTLRR